MGEALQWIVPIVVGILTFFLGQAFERRKIAQANRLKLLEPIEEWVDGAKRIVGIVGDDISSVASGLLSPTTYSDRERLETAKSLTESKEKVLGILKSKALSTLGTRQYSTRLSALISQLSTSIEQGYLQADAHLLEKMNLRQDLTVDIINLLAATSSINNVIQEIHTCIAQLKVRYT